MTTLPSLLDSLRELHDWIRDLVVSACEQHTPRELSQVVHSGAGDVTFMVDRIGETALVEWLTRNVACHQPIVLVGEGLPDGCVTLPDTATSDDAAWRLIIDPIDGTRGLMYQKRPGWILTGVAPNCGPATSLADVVLAVQTEIPLQKQHLSDQLWAIHGEGAHGVRYDRSSGATTALAISPSTATTIRDGFATVCRFFPGGRDVLAALDDELCDRLIGPTKPGEAAVSNDQYACTGGQIFGLAMGQDRFVADLRPLVRPIVHARGQSVGHCCHPYDLCTKLIAEEAGVIVTGPLGEAIDAPLDTESDVAWIGYANPQLQRQIGPVLSELLRKYGLVVPDSTLRRTDELAVER